MSEIITESYKRATEIFAEFGVDTEKAVETLSNLSLSLHCWQADDVSGFESKDSTLSGGGIQVTGSYSGKARNIDEVRSDLKKVFSLIPGNNRLNLHAIYGEFGGKPVDRDKMDIEHFSGWADWAKAENLKLDFNATCFSHPKADSGFTVSSKDKTIREFWINHIKQCRKIAAFFGKEQNSPCIHNFWIPDGAKDITVDKLGYRAILKNSLDKIFKDSYSNLEMKDALESKLFGIGSESFVVGSHEFYMGYAIKNNKMVCLDSGHFHPTESIADKISSLSLFSNEMLLHVSRPVRWDSDHVVILNDETKSIAEEVIRAKLMGRIHLALDYFDASINRVGAYVIGARATQKAFLSALLQPVKMLEKLESSGDNFKKLALLEEMKMLPLGAVWDYFCEKMNVPAGNRWIKEVEEYESSVLSLRG